MFPRLWERAVSYFQALLVSAYQEAERRAEATIAGRFEAAAQPPAPGVPVPTHTPGAPLPPVAPAATAPAVLPPVPPMPAVADGPVPTAPALPPKRPRGRPRKEPPSC